MGNKEWPDDWRVGNGAAWGCLAWPLAIIAGLLIGWAWRTLS